MTDGVTMGHPCCNEFDCKVPLAKVTDIYCQDHIELETVCAVEGCRRMRRVGYRTCDEESHKDAEAARKSRKKQPSVRRSGATDSANRKRRLKGAFGRKWTHNEQLMVRPCGVVIGRATFYSSESVSAVKVSRLVTTPTKELLTELNSGVYSKCLSRDAPRFGAGCFVFRQRM